MKKVATKQKRVMKRKEMLKDMKVSELAEMVAHGFADVQSDIQGARSEIEDVRARVVRVEQKTDRLQSSLNDFAYDSRKVRTRVENLELKVFGSVQEA